MRTAGNPISRRTFDELGIAKDDILYDQSVHTYLLPLTDANVEQLRGMSNIVSIERYESSGTGYWIFPNDDRFDWNEDNFGPLWIPKQGATVALTTENLPLYRRIIRNYEGNEDVYKRQELLYVVDYQHVYHLVEVDEIVHLLVQNGRCVLCLEFVHGDVEHLQIRVALFYLHSYRLGHMRFT